jgi:hypothetical protein
MPARLDSILGRALKKQPKDGTISKIYTRRMYKEFKEEFKMHFSYSCQLFQTDGSISKFMVPHMQSNYGATIIFNTILFPIYGSEPSVALRRLSHILIEGCASDGSHVHVS